MSKKKEICILSIHYKPIYSSCSALIEDLAISLKEHNFLVTIITPSSSIQNSCELTSEDGLDIVRIKTGNIRTKNYIYRFFLELTLPFITLLRLNKFIKKKKFDLIICYSPSIFWYYLLKKLKRNSKVYLILRDIFPQWIIDANLISKSSVIIKFLKFVERRLYNISDRIGVQSKKNIDYFTKNFPDLINKIETLHNWNTPKEYNNLDLTLKYSQQISKLKSKVVFVFGGVMDIAQDMPNIIRLIKSTYNLPNIFFLFMGTGSQIKNIKDKFNLYNIRNFLILENLPTEDYYFLLNYCSVGLVSLSPSFKTQNFPGKILSYMSAGIPILGSINKGNDLKDIIELNNCGLISINKNDDDFKNNALKLYNDQNYRNFLGKNSETILKQEFTTEIACEKIIKLVN